MQRLQWLLETEWLSPAEMRVLQFEKLCAMIAHAYKTVPYYQSVMRERGLTMSSFQHPDDLRRLPVLRREDLLAHKDALRSAAPSGSRVWRNFSSGSTGQRVEFHQDLDHKLWSRAHQLRAYGWCGGWSPGEPFALLWGNPVYWRSNHWNRAAINFASNRIELNAFRLGPHDIETMVRRLVAHRPRLISGYTTALFMIARRLREAGLALEGLRAVQPTAEPLPAAVRQSLAETLGCEVYNKYGSRETNMVAHESPMHEGMCIQAENVFVEFLRPDGSACADGEPGRVVVTTLNNYAMPLLRYQTGDIAAPLERTCSTGRGLPMMTPVEGRLHDVLRTPVGDEIHPQVFSNVLMMFEEVQWFQIVQEQLDRLRLMIVAPRGLSPSTKSAIGQALTRQTGYPFELDFETLAEMPASPTGKFRLCVNSLDQGHEAR